MRQLVTTVGDARKLNAVLLSACGELRDGPAFDACTALMQRINPRVASATVAELNGGTPNLTSRVVLPVPEAVATLVVEVLDMFTGVGGPAAMADGDEIAEKDIKRVIDAARERLA